MGAKIMRHDWYQATIDPPAGATVSQVLDVLASLGDECRPAYGLARMYRYETGYGVFREDVGPVAHVLFGGQQGTVHAFASGDDTGPFVDLVRENFGDCHRVTRADAAQDLNEAGAYDRVRESLIPIAEHHRVSFLQYEDELDATAGRTQYMGSPRSNCRLRLYEKGLQQKALVRALSGGHVFQNMRILNPATGELVEPENWTRIEAQVRPPDDLGKRWLASASAEEVWSCSPWLRDVGGALLSLQLEEFVMTSRKKTGVDRALQVMAAQYQKAITKKMEQLGGSPEAFGVHLAALICENERRRRTGVV
jgi:hypothetical protein